MTIQNFANFVDNAIVKKGQKLFADGKVTALEEAQEGLWVANVTGKKNTHEVEVLLHKNTVKEFSCDCPDAKGKICPHVVAVYKAIDARKQAGKAPKKPKALTFAKLVESIPLAELQNFLTEYASQNKIFKNDFELHFVEHNPNTDFEKVFTEIVEKNIKARSKNGDISNATEVAKEIKKYIKTAETHTGAGNYRDSFFMLKSLYLKIHEISLKMDLNTTLINYCDKIVENISFIVEYDKVATTLKEKIYEFLHQQIDTTNMETNIFKETFFKAIETLAIKLQKTKEYDALLDKKISLFKKKSDERKRFYLLKKISLLTKLGNTKEVEKLIDAHIVFPDFRTLRINQYMEREEYDKARDLLLEGIAQTDLRYSHNGYAMINIWEEMLYTIAYKTGDTLKERYYAQRFAFKPEKYNADYYQKWKNTFKKEDFDTQLADMIQKSEKKAANEIKKHKKWGNRLWQIPEELKKLCFIYECEHRIDKLWETLKDTSASFIAHYLPVLKDYNPDEVKDRLFEHIDYDLKTAFTYSEHEEAIKNLTAIAKTFTDDKTKKKLEQKIRQYKEKYDDRRGFMRSLKVFELMLSGKLDWYS